MEQYTYYHIDKYGERMLCPHDMWAFDLRTEIDQKNEVYRSYFQYDESILAHKEIHKGSLEGFQPKLMCSKDFLFDLDSEDLQVSYTETQKLVAKLKDSGCEPQVWFSGSKGFHVVIPQEVFGGFEPHQELNLIHKRIAQLTAEELNLTTVDLSIYSRQRSFRCKYSYHKGGSKKYKQDCYKVPVDIFEDSIETVLKKSSMGMEVKPSPRISNVVKTFENSKKSAYMNYRESSNEYSKFTNQQPLTKIDTLSRHNTIVSKAGELSKAGVFVRTAVDMIHGFNIAYCEPPLPFEEIVKQVTYVYNNYNNEQLEDEFTTMNQGYDEYVEDIKNPQRAGKTKWALDNTLEFQRGNFVILGGKSGSGKTTLYCNTVYRLAAFDKKESAIISLEMPKRKLAEINLSIHMKSSEDNLASAHTIDVDGFQKMEAMKQFRDINTKLHIYSSYKTIDEYKLDKLIGSLKVRSPDLHTVFIDYLGCLKGDTTELPQAIKRMALKHDVCIVGLAQIKKYRGQITLDKYSPLIVEDIKDSSELINAADDIVLIWRGKLAEEYIHMKHSKARYKKHAENTEYMFSYVDDSRFLDCRVITRKTEETPAGYNTYKEEYGTTQVEANVPHVPQGGQSTMPAKKQIHDQVWGDFGDYF